MWQGVDYLFIDEVSMIGCILLAQISEVLSIAKGNSLPFGGINVVFAGDFAQLPPVGQVRLYSILATSQHATKQHQTAILGKLLWLSVDTVVLLTEVVRQGGIENTYYRDLLFRLRTGSCTTSDFSTLNTRLLTSIIPHQDNAVEWQQAPFIVCDNEIKDALNVRATLAFASRTGRSLHWYHSADRISRKAVTDQQLQEQLHSYNSGLTGQHLGKLPLVIGMPVMIVQNFDVSNGIVNGATGRLKSIRYMQDDAGVRHAHSCVLEGIEAVLTPLPNLSAHEAAIIEDTTDLTFRHPHSGKNCKVRRTQLPIQPAFAMTAHKSQGQSMDRAIIDLEGCSGSESPYVMLSRVRSLEGVVVLRPFAKKKVTCRPSEDRRKEEQRLQIANLLTMQKYGTTAEQLQALQLLTSTSYTPSTSTRVTPPRHDLSDEETRERLQTAQSVSPSLSNPTMSSSRKRKLPISVPEVAHRTSKFPHLADACIPAEKDLPPH